MPRDNLVVNRALDNSLIALVTELIDLVVVGSIISLKTLLFLLNLLLDPLEELLDRELAHSLVK